MQAPIARAAADEAHRYGQRVFFAHLKSRGMPGMRGDLTILSEDPALGNPEAFTKVRYTIRGGTVIWRLN
jgi:hypothetical protein